MRSSTRTAIWSGSTSRWRYQLARDLQLGLEFVPVSRAVLDAGLDPAICDLIMSGAVITADRALHVQYSVPYLDETVAFIVPDHLASAFSEWASIRAMGHLRVGVPRGPYFIRKIRDELNDVEIVPIDDMEDMFKPHDPPIDAFVATAERGVGVHHCCIPRIRSPCQSRGRSECRWRT